MRLTCPKCDAEYEIPDRVIPLKGRDVQCSNCNKTWFFAHPDHVELDADPDPATEAPPPAAPTRRKLDPTVAEILRAEAEHEARMRSGATPPDAPDPARRAREARARVARMRGDAPEAARTLPDIEAINSTMRGADTINLEIPDRSRRQNPRGFATGLVLIVLLAVLLALAYTNARSIGAAVPQAEPYLDLYVSKVDQGRVWLHGLITRSPPQ